MAHYCLGILSAVGAMLGLWAAWATNESTAGWAASAVAALDAAFTIKVGLPTIVASVNTGRLAASHAAAAVHGLLLVTLFVILPRRESTSLPCDVGIRRCGDTLSCSP